MKKNVSVKKEATIKRDPITKAEQTKTGPEPIKEKPVEKNTTKAGTLDWSKAKSRVEKEKEKADELKVRAEKEAKEAKRKREREREEEKPKLQEEEKPAETTKVIGISTFFCLRLSENLTERGEAKDQGPRGIGL